MNKEMIEIRKAQHQDIAAVYKMGENVDEFRTSNQAPNFWPEAVLLDCVDSDDVDFLIASIDGEIVGFVIVNLNKSLSKALIENIFVKPAFRKQGIGFGLVTRAIDRARSDGYQFISVLTPPNDHAAIKTYQKAGFSTGEIFLWMDI